MSLNLIYVSKTNRFRWQDLSFQTPTKLTQQVMAAGGVEKQLVILEAFIEASEWWGASEKRRLIQELRMHLNGDWKLGST